MGTVAEVRQECIYSCCDFHKMPSGGVHHFALSIREGECSRWNYVWLIPVNVLANLSSLVYTVVAAVCHLLACAVFSVMACCTLSADNRFRYALCSACHLDGCIDALINDPVLFTTRMLGFMELRSAFCYRTSFGERMVR